MEGQGDLFAAGYLEVKPPVPAETQGDLFAILERPAHDTARIRKAVFQRLQPIAETLKK